MAGRSFSRRIRLGVEPFQMGRDGGSSRSNLNQIVQSTGEDMP
jgi:hypothetical protein